MYRSFSSLRHTVTERIAQVLLFPVHSKSTRRSEGFRMEDSHAIYSGVAKSANIIAVRVLNDGGCVRYPSLRGLSDLLEHSTGLAPGPICALSLHEVRLHLN